jgi:GT2 family glycosyltransferase/glycosyltransferase involved in cell wall biosynthesis
VSETRGLDEAGEWHRIAEERRRQLERLQDQRLYRVAASALARGRRAARVANRIVEPIRRVTVRLLRSAVALPSRLRAPAREAALRSQVDALAEPAAGVVRREDVTAVIVSAHQPKRLGALLTALGRIGITTIVVDNAGRVENATVVAGHAHARRLALTTPVSYATANEIAIAEVATPWVLLLNDDVAPIDDHWLDRMLAAVDDGTVAVGAQLVHGRRGLLGGEGVDGLVQHAGIGFVLDGPLARPVHLHRNGAPEVSDDVRVVPAATAACLLVRVEAHRAVGGFHSGFVYGSEDVDLCLRLSERGAVRVAMGAVLHHEEGATRLRGAHGGDRRARARRQAANRALLDARHAPALRRRVVTTAMEGGSDGTVRLDVGVAGPVPPLLQQMFDGTPAVRVVRRGGRALTVVTDPRLAPAGGSTGGSRRDVPIVGWVADSRALSTWRTAALGRIDALIVGPGVDAEVIAARLATLPLHRVDSAADVHEVLRRVLLAPRWSVRIGTPRGRGAARWGDGPVAATIARELRAHGLVVREVGRDRWGSVADRAADVTLHLKGRGVAPVADAQTNIVWVLSHPSEVAPGELEAADLVVAGSSLLAQRYRRSSRRKVAVLPQAADGRRFRTGPPDPVLASRILFVGNTRSVPRPAALGALDAGLPLTLIGSGWGRFVDPRLVLHTSIPYGSLPAWYRSAEVVLNDHWEDMARWGLVSNRVFDALACGACVVSDEVRGMDTLLDDAVVTFRDREDVGPTVRRLLTDPAERRARAERGQRAVLAAHTWEHRAAELVRLVAAIPGAGTPAGKPASGGRG